jgi:hypothetical protein
MYAGALFHKPYRRFDFSRKSRLPNEFITPSLLDPQANLHWR